MNQPLSKDISLGVAREFLQQHQLYKQITGDGELQLNAFDIEKLMADFYNEIVNKPHAEDFIESVKMEMIHHGIKWGDESREFPHHFNMVISFLNGKMAQAIWGKDKEKFLHHLVTIAAVVGTCHKYFQVDDTQIKTWFEK